MKLLATTLFTLGFISSLNAQLSLKRSTINANGSFKQSSSGSLSLISATSQASSIKIQESSTLTLRQGFLQPFSQSKSFGIAHISIYPNPSTNGILSIDLTNGIKAVEIKIYSLKGRMVFSSALDIKKESLDISHLPKGQYQVVINQFGKYLGTRKIILL